MASTERLQGLASCFPSIEKRHGQPAEHWFDVLRTAGDLKHMEWVTLLKSEHELGHGHANALVSHHMAKR